MELTIGSSTDMDAQQIVQDRLDKYSMPEPNTGCYLWFGATTTKGYGHVRIGGRKGKVLYSHRLAFELANGPIPNGMHVLHRCDNPCCCNPDHLFVGTDADNSADMISKDRQCRGERNSMAKLTDDVILAIRSDPRSLRLIALDYDVDIKQIHRIKRRETWKHIAQ